MMCNVIGGAVNKSGCTSVPTCTCILNCTIVGNFGIVPSTCKTCVQYYTCTCTCTCTSVRTCQVNIHVYVPAVHVPHHWVLRCCLGVGQGRDGECTTCVVYWWVDDTCAYMYSVLCKTIIIWSRYTSVTCSC